MNITLSPITAVNALRKPDCHIYVDKQDLEAHLSTLGKQDPCAHTSTDPEMLRNAYLSLAVQGIILTGALAALTLLTFGGNVLSKLEPLSAARLPTLIATGTAATLSTGFAIRGGVAHKALNTKSADELVDEFVEV